MPLTSADPRTLTQIGPSKGSKTTSNRKIRQQLPLGPDQIQQLAHPVGVAGNTEGVAILQLSGHVAAGK